jgi:hypothetical protein
MKNTSSKQYSQRFELNALAPLRVPGIAQALLDGKNDPIEVEKLANELMDLSHHLLELLVAEGDRAGEL